MAKPDHQNTILITGCSTGIGLASVCALRARGWRVIATARKPEDIARLKVEVGVETLELEMSDPASVERCARDALEIADGRLDALFNNAAYGTAGAMEDTRPDVLRRLLEINVVATHALTYGVIPAMRRAGGGRIINCSSVLGFIAPPYRGAYSASKFAIEAISDAMRIELAPAGIFVSLIEPGPIATQFLPTALSTFEETIDVENSPHREIYRARVAQMMGGGTRRFVLPPEAVAETLVKALESRRPAARYRVGLPTEAAAFGKRVLGSRLMDAILKRI